MPPKVPDYIVREADKLLTHPATRSLSIPAMQEKLLEYVEGLRESRGPGYVSPTDVPSERWLYDRKRRLKAASSSSWWDSDWTLASLDSPDFVVGRTSVADLMAARREAFLNGEPFSNRIAKWVARLLDAAGEVRSGYPDNYYGRYLWFGSISALANEYADDERIAHYSGNAYVPKGRDLSLALTITRDAKSIQNDVIGIHRRFTVAVGLLSDGLDSNLQKERNVWVWEPAKTSDRLQATRTQLQTNMERVNGLLFELLGFSGPYQLRGYEPLDHTKWPDSYIDLVRVALRRKVERLGGAGQRFSLTHCSLPEKESLSRAWFEQMARKGQRDGDNSSAEVSKLSGSPRYREHVQMNWHTYEKYSPFWVDLVRETVQLMEKRDWVRFGEFLDAHEAVGELHVPVLIY